MSAKILHFQTPSVSDKNSSNASSGSFKCRISGNRHLWGTVFLSRHFSSAFSARPSSRPAPMIVGQLREVDDVLLISQYSDYSSERQGQIRGRLGRAKKIILSALYHWLGNAVMTDRNENEEVAIFQRARASLRAFRTSKGWSQREMAKFLQVSEDNYEKYESDDERGVPVIVIARFCEYTDTDVNWILYGRRSAAKTG